MGQHCSCYQASGISSPRLHAQIMDETERPSTLNQKIKAPIEPKTPTFASSRPPRPTKESKEQEESKIETKMDLSGTPYESEITGLIRQDTATAGISRFESTLVVAKERTNKERKRADR